METRAVLVTGTSSGIGAATVVRLARAGWRVYAGVRREADGKRIASAAGEVVPVRLDVTDRGQIDAALGRIDDEVGRLHGLVSNAGVGAGGPIGLTADEQWRHPFDVNFFGVVTLVREALPLVEKAHGRFVHIGSLGGRVGLAGLGPYSASKHALEGFNWTLRQELRRTGVSSSLVEPGATRTAIWEKGEETLGEFEPALAGPARERYGFVADTVRGFIAESRRMAVHPDRVAKAVEHALTARRPRARYLVGPDAKAIGTLVTRLPDRAHEWILGLYARYLEHRGRKLR